MEHVSKKIDKIKDKIKSNRIKFGSLKYKESTTNKYSEEFDEIEDDIKICIKDFNILNKELISEVDKEKKEKLLYKKSLNKLRFSVQEFQTFSKSDSKLKRGTEEIINILNSMDKYIK